MAVAEIVFFLWIILIWKWKQYRPDFKNPLTAAIMFFLAVSFASAIFGANFSTSFWSNFERMSGVLMLIHLVAFTIAASSVLEKRDWMRILCVSVGVAVVAGIQAMFDLSKESRGGGLIGNDSFFGTYLLFNIFFALYLLFAGNSSKALMGNFSAKLRSLFLGETGQISKTKIFAAVAFFLLSFCLVFESTQFWKSIVQGLSYSYPGGLWRDVISNGARAAKFSFLGGLLIFLLLRLVTSGNKIIRKITIALIGLGIAVGLYAVSLAFQGNDFYHSLTKRFGVSAMGSRVIVWQISWKGFLDRPYLGWGPDNFGLAFARHYNPCLGSNECGADIWYDRAHNIVLDTLVETGAIGLIAYILIFIAAIYVLWKAFFSKRTDFAAPGAFTALFIAYFIQNLTVFDMITSYLMFYLCLAFIIFLNNKNDEIGKVWPLPLEPLRFMFVSAIFIIIFAYYIIGPLSSDRGAILAVRELYNSGNMVPLARNALEASSMGKYQLRIFFAEQWMIGLRNQTIVSKLTREQARETFEFLAQELEKSCQENPLDYQSNLQLGAIYNNWWRLDMDKEKILTAENSIKKAIEISPNNQRAYGELVSNYLYQSRIDDARAAANKALELYPSSQQPKAMFQEIETYQAQIINQATGTEQQ